MAKLEVRLDNIDLNILELLSRDGRTPITQISKCLAKNGESLTSRTVWNRIKRLEKYRIIQGYRAILNPALFARKETMIILLKFAPLHDNADIDKLSSHLRGSSFCFFATQMIGGAEEYDYACSLLCDTKQQFNSQLELILNTFRNLISDYQVCKSKIIKEIPRALPSADNLEEVKTLGSLSEQADEELEDIQNLLSRSNDEAARDMAATAGYTLPD